MQHTTSYQQLVDIRYEAEDVKSGEIDSIKDDLLTGIINEGEAFGWTFADVLGYLTEEGITAWEIWTQQTLKGGAEPATQKAFDDALDAAAESVAVKIHAEIYE